MCCKKNPINYGFNLTDNAYEPLKLMQAVMAKTNEVCLRYRDNSMLCSLPVPSTTYYETSIFAIRNRRRKMEDRHVAIHDLNTMFNVQEASPSSYYAIFDGHAGHDAAAYSAAHLHQFLAENKYFMSNPEQALLDAFCKTDALFLEKCKVENLTGGTTAVVALLRPKEKTLYIAWVGDSQALLVKQGKALQCVNPHKPCREDERQRIEKAGGCVMLWGTWRVNGQLAVSRAIGDAEYKPHVIAIPDVKEISLDGGEDFLIIACDGLWDYVSEDAAAQEVYYLVAQNPDDTEIIGRHLSQLARYKGSTDNISVIVVFLKEPHQIAAEANRLACKNGPSLTTDNNMETSLDNANNPFTNSNGSLKNLEVDTDNIELRKDNDGLMLNLADSFKTNVRGIKQELFMTEKSNGTKNSTSDIHFDDDFGPETDVDAIDDAFSPLEKDTASTDGLTKGLQDDEGIPKSFNDESKAFTEGLANNNPLEVDFNPFVNDQNKKDENGAEMNFEDFCGANRGDTPTPPIDTIHDVSGLEVNPTESDSEDEWNYIKGDQAKPEVSASQPETVVETSEQEDAMSQLNPDAAEFVPISPTRSIPSPACRTFINDEVVSRSPTRPRKVDINVPSEDEFELGVKSRPKDFENYKNGHESDSNNTSEFEKIEKILNHRNIDEIPEFHPGSTPNKQLSDEFHFGPNATPFTPKALDQSDAFSTKANHGDETLQTLDDSEFVPSKEQTDPMSMSFYAEKGESNPFEDEDLNKVHLLPDNLDEFIGEVQENKENTNLYATLLEQVDNLFQGEKGPKSDNLNELIGDADDSKNNSNFDDTISDLPEHEPLGKQLLDNDQAIQITDLDKISQDDEKELASPMEENEELLNIPSNDTVFQKNVEDTRSSEEFEFVNAPLNPEVLAEELVAKSPDIQSQSVVPEKIEQEPFLNNSENLACEFTPGNKISEADFEVPKSPVCELKSANTLTEAEVSTKSEVENIQSQISEVTSSLACEYTATSPVPVCEDALEEAPSPVLVCQSPECVSKDSSVLEQKQGETVSHSPTDLLQELKQDDEVTSSVKDDVSSPIEPLLPGNIGQKEDEELASLVEDYLSSPNEASPGNLQKSLLEEIATAGEHGSTVKTDSSEIEGQNIVPDLLCPLPVSQPILAPTDAPTETVNQLLDLNQTSAFSNGLNNFASEFNEQICIKTDSITPEFAEPTVITPSEESKMDDIVAESPVPTRGDILVENVPTPEPVIAQDLIEAPKTEAPKEIAAVAPVLVQEVKPIKNEKKTTSAKKPIGKLEQQKPTAPKVGAAKAPTASKVGISAKPAPKLGMAKPMGAATKTTASAATGLKATLKPKTTSRIIEKKPAATSELKPAPRTTLTKKPATEAPLTKTTTRPATTAAKASPTKTTAPRPATAPRTLAPKAAPAKPTTLTAPKPRVPLSSRTSGTASKTTTTATTKTTSTLASKAPLAPKPTTAAPPKPKTLVSSPKPRAPLTKTITKGADVEKEKKESANKLTASRTSTITRTTSGAASTRTTTTTLKKTETKLVADKTSPRSVTMRNTTLTKKPIDLKTTKTKTTKVEKPKENGVAPTTVTQEIKEITIVNNVINQSESETENLVKDISPLDNKLLIDPNNALDANPAD